MLMMGTFVQDKRAYVTKRQRIDAVARCLEQQCILVADLVDASHQQVRNDSLRMPSRSLSQTFPFPDCPPTVSAQDGGGSQSACLGYLIEAVRGVYDELEAYDMQVLRNVVRNITGAFDAAFSCWSVGVGMEDQLNTLRCCVGLKELDSLAMRRSGLYLGLSLALFHMLPPALLWHVTQLTQLAYIPLSADYKRMVRPEAALSSYHSESYRHSEDFFFRSVHLGTECWCFVALDRLRLASAYPLLGSALHSHSHHRYCIFAGWPCALPSVVVVLLSCGHRMCLQSLTSVFLLCAGQDAGAHQAAALIRDAALIIDYLGTNIMTLRAMNLRDYLLLKVPVIIFLPLASSRATLTLDPLCEILGR
jgi:hypothetical protein